MFFPTIECSTYSLAAAVSVPENWIGLGLKVLAGDYSVFPTKNVTHNLQLLFTLERKLLLVQLSAWMM